MASATAPTNQTANPPLPGVANGDGVQDGTSQLYDVLIAWVENGVAPSRIDISTVATTTFPVVKIQAHLRLPEESKPMSAATSTLLQVTCALEESGGGRKDDDD